MEMTEKYIIQSENYSDKLADQALWNPDLIAIISHVINSGSIVTKMTVGSENYHYLCWANTIGASDVAVEISKDGAFLLVNIDRYRGHLEQIALEGIAARFSLGMGEFEDEKGVS